MKTTICILLLLALTEITKPQQSEYPITLGVKHFEEWIETPIQIETIKVNGKEVSRGKAFQHNENWLKDLSLVIKNISKSPIAGFSVGIHFAHDNEGKPYLPIVEVKAGKQYTFSRDGVGPDLNLQPGQTYEVAVPFEWWESHRYHRSHHSGLPETILRRALLVPEYAGFDHDNIWLRGAYMHRDPDDEKTFLMDERQHKKITELLNRPTIRKAGFNRPIPGCSVTDEIKAVACIQPGCTNCSVAKVVPKNQSPGFNVITVSRECERVVGGQLVPCGCCQNVTELNYNVVCK